MLILFAEIKVCETVHQASSFPKGRPSKDVFDAHHYFLKPNPPCEAWSIWCHFWCPQSGSLQVLQVRQNIELLHLPVYQSQQWPRQSQSKNLQSFFRDRNYTGTVVKCSGHSSPQIQKVALESSWHTANLSQQEVRSGYSSPSWSQSSWWHAWTITGVLIWESGWAVKLKGR